MAGLIPSSALLILVLYWKNAIFKKVCKLVSNKCPNMLHKGRLDHTNHWGFQLCKKSLTAPLLHQLCIRLCTATREKDCIQSVSYPPLWQPKALRSLNVQSPLYSRKCSTANSQTHHVFSMVTNKYQPGPQQNSLDFFEMLQCCHYLAWVMGHCFNSSSEISCLRQSQNHGNIQHGSSPFDLLSMNSSIWHRSQI